MTKNVTLEILIQIPINVNIFNESGYIIGVIRHVGACFVNLLFVL